MLSISLEYTVPLTSIVIRRSVLVRAGKWSLSLLLVAMQVDQVYLEPVQTLLSQWIASSKLQHCTTHITGCGWCVGMWTCMWVFKGHMHVYMLMRDTEGRKKEASKTIHV